MNFWSQLPEAVQGALISLASSVLTLALASWGTRKELKLKIVEVELQRIQAQAELSKHQVEFSKNRFEFSKNLAEQLAEQQHRRFEIVTEWSDMLLEIVLPIAAAISFYELVARGHTDDGRSINEMGPAEWDALSTHKELELVKPLAIAESMDRRLGTAVMLLKQQCSALRMRVLGGLYLRSLVSTANELTVLKSLQKDVHKVMAVTIAELEGAAQKKPACPDTCSGQQP